MELLAWAKRKRFRNTYSVRKNAFDMEDNQLMTRLNSPFLEQQDIDTFDDSLVCAMEDNPYKLHKAVKADGYLYQDNCCSKLTDILFSESRQSYRYKTCEYSPEELHAMGCTYEAAAANDVKRLNDLLAEDPEKLQVKDPKGWTPLHKAVDKGSNDVLVIMLRYDTVDVNQLTNSNETALHIAVRQGHGTTIELLLNNGADGTIKNSKNMTPLHLSVQLGQYDAMKSLVKDKKFDVDVGGEFNMSALHLAACLDDVKAAKILMDYGAYLCRRCALGLTAVHYAAKNAAKNVLNLALELAESKGYTRDFLLSNQDKYKHSPLHAAINSGNTEPVKVCLEAGAKISSKQSDGSTPVHLVCSQGALNIVQLMRDTQPGEFKLCLTVQDDNGMIPLHRAVLFNYSDLAQFLIEQGSPLNVPDCNGKTPILLAASRHCWDSARVLSEAGANLCTRDLDNSNFIHLAIKNGNGLDDLWKSSIIKTMCGPMMNETDIYGCTPIHYASKDGNLASICGLLKKGAVITCKDNSKQSPLHFASKYGRVNTCRTLLDTIEGAYIMNEVNHEGKTALHLAAEEGHVKVVALLLQRGALLHRDYRGDNPLHLAAKNGYTQSMKLLLNVYPSLLNSENNAGNTPLHEAAIANKLKSIGLLLNMNAGIIDNKENRTFLDIAIEQANAEAAMAVINHNRWKEIMLLPSKVHGSYMLGMVKYLPGVASAVLDLCTEHSSDDPNSRDYHITYHFDLIDSKRDPVKDGNDEELTFKETSHAVLLAMVKYERLRCLSHPVCLQYVRLKWNSTGLWLHTLNVLLYLMYLLCFTSVIIKLGPPPNNAFATLTNSSDPSLPSENYADYMDTMRGLYTPIIIVMILLVFNVFKEVVQLVQLKWRYFLDITNAFEWMIYVTAALYIIPNLMGSTEDWPYICGAIALFFAWLNLLFFLQRFEFFGIYVVMFQGILKTLLQVLIVFSILIVAFGVTFHALMRTETQSGFTELGMSIFTSVVMMIGELNYLDWFVIPSNDGDPNTLRFQTVAYVALCGFLLLMPILLMNLLIGLAVGDIESVLKNARLKRLAMQVELIAEFDEKLPKCITKRFEKSSAIVYPNNCRNTILTMYETMVRGSDKDKDDRQEKNELQDIVMQQKQRIKELQSEMKTQTELLKLVVEKMEIKTESSYLDEGGQDENVGISLILRQASASSNGWRSKAMSGALTKMRAVKRLNSKTGVDNHEDKTPNIKDELQVNTDMPCVEEDTGVSP